MKKRPHIVILNPDEMRWDTMGHMGNRAAYTPVLDQLAVHEAVSFDHAYCQNPVCVPSRCSFLTGLYPHTRGHRTMQYLLHEDEPTLFSELKDAGYYVWLNGRNDFLSGNINGLEQKHANEVYYYVNLKNRIMKKQPLQEVEKKTYSHFHGVVDKVANDMDWQDTNAAIERIKHMEDLGDQTLCLFLGWVNPHPPYEVEKPYYDKIREDYISSEIDPKEQKNKSLMIEKLQEYSGLEDLSEEEWKEMRHVYLAQCAKVDAMTGAVCQALKDAGIYEDTAIFFLSDHGDFCGDYHLAEKAQNTFEDVLTRVPFLIKPPKGIMTDAGIAASPVELVDLYATVMDIAGVECRHDHFGRSLVDILSDRTKSVRTYAFAEGGRLPQEKQCDEWHASGENGPQKTDEYWAKKRAQRDDQAHEKGTMITDGHYKFVYRAASERHEFYDLSTDPYELKNLYPEIHSGQDRKEYRDVICRMKEKLLGWFQETVDTVPKSMDSRFTEEKIWASLRNMVPPEKEDEVRQYIREEHPTIMQAIVKVMRSMIS